jgi:hypothetical protein
MSNRNSRKAAGVFKQTKRELKPWEKTARQNAEKTERLRALRLAKEAAEREADAAKKAQ